MHSPSAEMPAQPASLSDTEPREIERIFQAQRATSLTLRGSTPAQRIAKLKRLRALVLERREAIIAACVADFARPSAEVELSEIMPVVSEARHAIRHLKSWMKPRHKRPTLLFVGTRSAVHTEPRGRCLIISPWNYPIGLSLTPLVSAIAAGNTVILKPSEMTPHCAAILGELVAALFDEDEVAVVQGAVDTAKTLLDQPFDHVFFTGSPAVGKQVMAAAARHLSSVTLELGGKSPVIIDASADLPKAARAVIWGKFNNNGQACIAPDHVYVHNNVRAAFVEAALEALGELYGGSTNMADNSDYGRIVNQAHLERLRSLLTDASERGATLASGGIPAEEAQYLPPTLVTDIHRDARLMQEEVFGPILPILGFSEIDMVIQDINDHPKPLALYIFSKENEVIDRVLQSTSAGGTCINTTMVHYLHPRLPFGGVNHSGLGKSHGHYGYLAFSNERAVLRDRFSLASLFQPPYNKGTRWFVRQVVRWLS